MGIRFGTRSAWMSDLTAGLKRLVVPCGFSSDCVFEDMQPPDVTIESPPNDRYVGIFNSRYGANTDGQNDGSPSGWNVMDGEILIDIYSRLSKGPPQRGSAAFLEQSRGFSDLTKKVAKAVHRVTLANDSGDTYLEEQTRVVSVLFNPAKNPLGWNKATVVLSVKFRADLS